MRKMWLMGANLIREQRYLAAGLGFYVIAMTTFLSREKPAAGDVAFLIKQQAIYAVLFSAMLALSTLHNERKTRRILAVLSKSVTRGEYLGGLLLGMMVLMAGYCGMAFLGGAFLGYRAGIPVGQVALMMLTAMVASLLAAAVALLFASAFHPVPATMATGAAIALPLTLELYLGHSARYILPVYSLCMRIVNSPFDLAWGATATLLAAGMAQAVVVLLLAVAVFSLKDIAVAVE